MAVNAFIKPEVIAKTAIGLLQRELIVPQLMWQWSKNDFIGAKDDAVNVVIPGTTAARDRDMRATGEQRKITLDTMSERKIQVKLDKFPYNAIAVTDEEMTMDITNFGEQILAPQVRAMAEYIEKAAVKTISSATYADGGTGDTTLDKGVKGTLKAEDFFGDGQLGMYSLFNRVRTQMNKRNLPANNRIVLIGADVEEEILNSPNLVRADEAGDSNALRDATIGKLAGFTFVSSNSVPANEAYAFHKSAFVLATAAPVIPAGAKAGSTISHGGLALRWLRDYDANYAIDRSIVDTFLGTGVVADGEGDKFIRGFKITMDSAAVAKKKKGAVSV